MYVCKDIMVDAPGCGSTLIVKTKKDAKQLIDMYVYMYVFVYACMYVCM